MRRRKKPIALQLTIDLVLLCLVGGLIYALMAAGRPVAAEPEHLALELRHLPAYAVRSLTRMIVAYIISLLFSLSYGYVAATYPAAGRIMIPLLDVLQSVPVLGFFPAAVYFFVQLFRGSILGVELASIFLIFTGQAWNMTFGVYESLTTIPKDLVQALQALGVKGMLAFKRLHLPATVSKLIYNSMLSWAGGWYFLIACEIISFGPVHHTLPGLGSFLIKSAEQGHLGLTLAGLLVLVTVIVLLNALVWAPLLVWGDKYKYEFTAYGARPQSTVLRLLEDSYLVPRVLRLGRWVQARVVAALEAAQERARAAAPRPERRRMEGVPRNARLAMSRIGWIGFAGIALIGVWKLALTLVPLLRGPWPSEVKLLPLALGASALRLAVAYVISIAWTLPVAVWVGLNERAEAVLMPVAQVLASVPATALFPVIVAIMLNTSGGIEVASVLLVLTGMQWYILFNLVAGVKAIPGDLLAAARAFQVKGKLFFQKVLLPGMFPSLVTGSITGWGGGWNALIVSEYVVYGGKAYKAFGIGSMLDVATYETGNLQVMWFSLLSMVLFITVMNRLVWRPLYQHASRRYKIEY
ncbi:MAG: ABC transporter permease subunit [Bacillota bacterium]